jgi:hypothetical protein
MSQDIFDPKTIAEDVTENRDATYIEVALANIALKVFERLEALESAAKEAS